MAPAKTFRTMWDSSQKSTSFLPLNLRPLLGWGSVLWFLAAGTSKIMNDYWILSDAFCESIEIMTWLLFLNIMLSLNWVDYVEPTCISRINPHLYGWIWVAKLFFRFSASYVHEEYLQLLSLCLSLFGVSTTPPPQAELGSISSFFMVLSEFR